MEPFTSYTVKCLSHGTVHLIFLSGKVGVVGGGGGRLEKRFLCICSLLDQYLVKTYQFFCFPIHYFSNICRRANYVSCNFFSYFLNSHPRAPRVQMVGSKTLPPPPKVQMVGPKALPPPPRVQTVRSKVLPPPPKVQMVCSKAPPIIKYVSL